jgi:hypothetical protein
MNEGLGFNWGCVAHCLPSCSFSFGLYGRFSPGTSASSTNKTGRRDIAEILLKVSLNTIDQSINVCVCKITPYA